MSLGILCSGQGAQGPTMFDLVKGHREAEAILQLTKSVLGADMREILIESPDKIYLNSVAQPLVCAAQLATWAALEPQLPGERVFAGYSVGELAAYGCAGALQPAPLIELAAARARTMDASCRAPCRMTAVRYLERTVLQPLIRSSGVHIAIINGEDHFIVAGLSPQMDVFETAALEKGGRLTQLRVGIASHTPWMSAAATQLQEYLQQVPLIAPVFRVLAGVDGLPIMSRERAIETLCAQIASPVDWAACLQGLREAGCTALLELGPGADLACMARRRCTDLPARSVSEFHSLRGVVEWVRGTIDVSMSRV